MDASVINAAFIRKNGSNFVFLISRVFFFFSKTQEAFATHTKKSQSFQWAARCGDSQTPPPEMILT